MEWGAGVKQPGSAECGTLLDIGQDKPWETLARAFSVSQPRDQIQTTDACQGFCEVHSAWKNL